MIIPDTSPVPDWMLELMRVAPDEWQECGDEGSAKRRLLELQTALTNPDLLYALCRVVCGTFDAGASVDNHILNGPHDVFNQQQLIGEKRGLRRILVEISDIREKLQAVARV